MSTKHPGKITISRTDSNVPPYESIHISIKISTDASTEFVTVTMSLEEYARCISGLGYRPCEVEVWTRQFNEKRSKLL
jgi:hypothetical protein